MMETYVLLTWSYETGATLDEFDTFEEAYQAAEKIVTESDWSFEEALIDILTIKGSGFQSVLTERLRKRLVTSFKYAVKQREEAL